MINDFIEYWTTAKLLLIGGKPYSPADLYESQKALGWAQPEPLLMWNPPWTLSFTMPLGLLDYQSAQFVWFLSHALIIFVGAQWLWEIYGGSPDKSRYALVASLFFAPVYFVLLLGQIGPLILLGLIAFLASIKSKQWSLAGTSLTFAAIKPHLVYLLWLALFLWTLRTRHWKPAIFLMLTGVMVAGIPLLLEPQIYSQYVALFSRQDIVRPMDWATPSLGTAAAELLSVSSLWVRWLPAIGGAIWFLCYWSWYSARWDWLSELPLLVIVSVTTSSFVWTFDLVVLLPAVIQGAVWVARCRAKRKRRLLIGTYMALGATALAAKAVVLDDFWYFWLAPAYLCCYLYARASVRPPQEA